MQAAGAFGPGLPEPTPAGHAGDAGLVPVNYRVPTYAARQTLSPSPTR
jgi:hypothetical protein